MSTKLDNTDFTQDLIKQYTEIEVSSFSYPAGLSYVSTEGGEQISLIGSGFTSDCSIYLNKVKVTTQTYVSATQIIFTVPSLPVGDYIISVVNPYGNISVLHPGISVNNSIYFTTNSGSLGTIYNAKYYSIPVQAVANSAITYSVVSGTLPTGLSLDSSTGVISGTTSDFTSDQIYSFTIQISNISGKTTTRSFSLAAVVDIVTWVYPINNNIVQPQVNQAFSLILNATTTSGRAVTYSASGLPTWLSLTGNTLSGTNTATSNITVSLTATLEGLTNSATISLIVNTSPIGQAAYTTAGTFTWTAPAGVTYVSAVCVGGGAGGSVGTGYYGNSANGGGGGGLAWVNYIPVTPGQGYTVVVGAAGAGQISGNQGYGTSGGDSYFINNTTVKGGGGLVSPNDQEGGNGGVPVTATNYGTYGGGSGGKGGGAYGWSFVGCGGGGAGGYTGNGGKGGNAMAIGGSPATDSGGGGGGGGGQASGFSGYISGGGGGGGVGILGKGADGIAAAAIMIGGGGGSSGVTGTTATMGGGSTSGSGGIYGAGAGGNHWNGSGEKAGNGAVGAVRLIWGANRAYPSTNTGNV